MTKAIEDVLAERRRQVEVEGWTPEHDDAHRNGEIARAAMGYTQAAATSVGADTSGLRDRPPSYWPWSRGWWKPKDRRRDLVRAGALILAEIERLDRIEEPRK